MAKAFGVTEEYVHHKIDCMAGTVLTNGYLNYVRN
jgi:hypothetical protein